MSILLKGGTVVSAYNRRQLDIRIDGEQIVEMGANLPVENSQIEELRGVMYYQALLMRTRIWN